MKRSMRVLVILVIVILVIGLSKNLIAKKAVKGIVNSITGLALDIDSLKLGIFTALIDMKGLKLHNPPDFPDKIMADMPEIYVDYDMGAMFRKKIHLKMLKLHLREFVVVRNKSGKLNIKSLKGVEREKEKKAPAPSKKEKEPLAMQIDVLELKIDRVIYKDYSQGGPPLIKEYNVYLSERYTDISDAQKLVKLVLYKAMIKTAIARLGDFDMSILEEGMSGIFKRAGKIVEESATKALEKGAGVEEAGKKVLEGGEGAAKDTVDTLKKVFEGIKLPVSEEK